jgi:hypothetical protein
MHLKEMKTNIVELFWKHSWISRSPTSCIRTAKHLLQILVTSYLMLSLIIIDNSYLFLLWLCVSRSIFFVLGRAFKISKISIEHD